MSMYPENPAGQTFISQDTYASAGAALSGLGGGGTSGPVPANLALSTLKIGDFGFVAFPIIAENTGGSIPSDNIAILEGVFKDSDGNGADALGVCETEGLSNITADLAVNRLLLGSQGTGSNNAARGTLSYNLTNSTLSLKAPSVGISSLVGVSSINATPFFAPRSGIFFMPVGTTTGYYDIPNPPAGITTNAVVMCVLTRPDGTSQNWIVNSGVVQGSTPANWYIEVVMASAVVDDNTAVAWDLVSPDAGTLGVAISSPV